MGTSSPVMRRNHLAVLAIPAFILAIGVAAILDVRGIYEPHWLLPIVNLLCLFLPGCLVAYVSLQGYRSSGSVSLLFFGSAAMLYGTCSAIGGWMIGVLGAMDAGIVLHNTGAAMGALLNVASGVLAARVSPATRPPVRPATVLLLYGGLGALVAGLSVASLHGLTPTFVRPGGGFTPTRELTLGIAVMGFVTSAVLFWKRYLERRSEFLYWGTLALAMLSIGLFGLVLQRGMGTLVGWLSRSAQYVGSVYLLMAVVQAWRAAQRLKVPVARALANFFQAAEAHYRVLVETATDAIIAIDHEGIVLLWNGAAEELCGYRREEAVGSHLGDRIGLRAEIARWGGPGPGAEHQEGITRLEHGLQTLVQRKDGTTFPAELSVSACHTDAGWVGTIILRDVSARTRAAEQLARRNRDLRTISLCNQALVHVTDEAELLREICRIIVDEGGHAMAWVGFLEETDGVFRPVAAVGCAPDRVDRHRMDPADPAWATCPVTLALRTGIAQVVENIPGNPPRCAWHDEAVRLGYGSSVSLPLKEDGRPVGALTIYSAPLDAFSAEEVQLLGELADDLAYGIRALRTHAAHARALAEIEGLARFPSENPNPVLRVREDGRVLYANAASAGLLHLWATAIGDRMPTAWVASVRNALETGQQDIVEVSCDERVYSFVLAPIRDADYANLYGRDVTAQKRLEADRLRLEAQLRQQQKLEAIGTLAGGVAHEINNPITGIMNYAQLIADTAAPDSPAAGHAREIIAETERVAAIVRNLLYFARHEKQAHSPAQIADLVEQTLTLLRAVLRRDQIALTVDVPADLPALKCRSQQIQQVLMNLLTNARDALNEKYPGYHPDKTLQVRVQPWDHDGRRWLRVTVADHGPGIPAAIQARIFDPFFTTKPREKGTGLGLSISHGIVQEHHGVLHYETEVGTGTQFHLDLPVDNGWTVEPDRQ